MIDSTGILVTVPSSIHHCNSMDQLITNSDMELGYITMNDAEKCLGVKKDKFAVNKKQKNILLKIIQDYKIDNSELGIWILEYIWTTYNLNDDPMSLTRKLPIKTK